MLFVVASNFTVLKSPIISSDKCSEYQTGPNDWHRRWQLAYELSIALAITIYIHAVRAQCWAKMRVNSECAPHLLSVWISKHIYYINFLINSSLGCPQVAEHRATVASGDTSIMTIGKTLHVWYEMNCTIQKCALAGWLHESNLTAATTEQHSNTVKHQG